MGRCPFCGEKAGMFKDEHAECRTKHDQAAELIKTRAAETVLGPTPFADVKPAIEAAAADGHIKPEEMKALVLRGAARGIEALIGRTDPLTEMEDIGLNCFLDQSGVTRQDLISDGCFMTVVKSAMLRDLAEGRLPNRIQYTAAQTPINLLPDEQVLIMYGMVKYATLRRGFGGYSQGFSIPIGAGVRYRVGGFRAGTSEPQMTIVGEGPLFITNQRLVHLGRTGAVNLPLTKIIGFSAATDGIELSLAGRGGEHAFITDDGWFINPFVHSLCALAMQASVAKKVKK